MSERDFHEKKSDQRYFQEQFVNQQTQNLDRWAEMAKQMQEPFQALAELNVRTLQNMSYISPEEYTNLKKPEELLEKQVNLAVENGHKALEYMQKSFQILERAMLGVVKEVRKSECEIKH